MDVVIEAEGRKLPLREPLTVETGEGLSWPACTKRAYLDPNPILEKELKIYGINAYERLDLEGSSGRASGQVDVTPLISRILPLKSAAEAFEP